jgi:steroid delta-isomerase-like uncharacterized protein
MATQLLQEDSMSQVKQLIDAHYDGLNRGDIDAAMQGFAANVETVTPNGAMTGLDAFRAFGQVFLTAVPDAKLTVDNYVESGDTGVVEGAFGGTQTGPFAAPNGEIPPTGKSFSFTFADIFVVKDGEIVSHHIYWDNMSFMAQLGLVPEG